jgi:ribosomal small subunit protein bTHX
MSSVSETALGSSFFLGISHSVRNDDVYLLRQPSRFFESTFGKFPLPYYTCHAKQNQFMGRGDKKSKKGKRTKGSYGKTRNRKAIKARIKRAASKKPAVAKTETKAKPARKVAKKAE